MNMKKLCALLLMLAISSISLHAQSPAFTLSVSPGSQSMTGSAAYFTVGVTPQNGFKASVVLQAYSPTLPAAVFSMRRGVISPPYTDTDTVWVNLTGPKTGGTHEIIVEGKNGPLVVRDTVDLTIPSKTAWQVYNTFNSPIPTNDLWSVVLDKQGHGWITTEHSLIEFDGSNWTIHDTSTGFPFAPNYTMHGVPWVMLDIAVDSSNNVWVTDGRALAKYDGTNWTKYSDTAYQAFYYDIATDSQGNVWIANGYHGIIKFDGQDWIKYTPEARRSLHTKIAVDGEGGVWITESEERGLKKFDGTFWTYFLPKDLRNQGLTTMTTDHEGVVWVGSVRNLFRCDSTVPAAYSPSDDVWEYGTPQTLEFDPEGTIWISTMLGVGKKSGAGWEFYSLDNSGLPSRNVSDVRVADDLSVWITTRDGGLAILDGTQSGYNSISTSGVEYAFGNGGEGSEGSEPMLYPNPIRSGMPLHINVENASGARLTLYSARGEEVGEISPTGLNTGEIQLDGRGLRSGAYYLRMEFPDRESIVRPFIVVD